MQLTSELKKANQPRNAYNKTQKLVGNSDKSAVLIDLPLASGRAGSLATDPAPELDKKPQTDPEPVAPQPARSSDSRPILMLFIGVALALICGALGYFAYSWQQSPEDASTNAGEASPLSVATTTSGDQGAAAAPREAALGAQQAVPSTHAAVSSFAKRFARTTPTSGDATTSTPSTVVASAAGTADVPTSAPAAPSPTAKIEPTAPAVVEPVPQPSTSPASLGCALPTIQATAIGGGVSQ